MTSYVGPSFQLVETITAEELAQLGGFQARDRPLLVKGAIKAWPAWEKWSFSRLAELKRDDGSEVLASFQNGLVEQGVTSKPLIMPIAPYLRQLDHRVTPADAQEQNHIGLCPDYEWRALKPGNIFHLHWDYLSTFKPTSAYLAQWDLLKEFPALRNDFSIRSLWPGWRWTWEYVFIGPAQTVTGLHYDFPHNWFCQVRGVKEFLLFPPENSPYLCKSKKYDWGATLSDINISSLDQQPEQRNTFAKAHGLYARVEPGDALFIPKRTWHAVVAREPSISLAVFGLTIPEIVIGGGASETRSLLHKLGLYRRGNCTCHRMALPVDGH